MSKDAIAPPSGYPAGVFEAYSTISELARSINLPVFSPEVVFIGKRNSGKSVLIESFLGHRFFDTSATLRPVEIRMQNNRNAEQPQVILQRDPIAAAADVASASSDVEVPLAKLPEALKERNVPTDVPIVVTYSFRYTWNMTVIDTPGMLSRGDNPQEMAAVEKLVLDLAVPQGRLVVCCEEVNEWDLIESFDFANKFDPKRERTVFVFNKFHPFIKNFIGSQELRHFFATCPVGPATRIFFTTSPGETGRPENPALYKRRLGALLKADLEALESMQYDKKFEKKVGAGMLQRSILDYTWQRHQGLISDILRRLRELGRQATDGTSTVKSQLASLSVGELRQRASNKLGSIIMVLTDLLLGSIEGRPAQYGQTLAEEKLLAIELGDWMDSKHEKIEVNPAASGIPSFESRLYGGQQFERLLAEFRAVVGQSVRAEISADEIATALGVGKVDVAPNIAWAASDIAQGKAVAAIAPLVNQLIERAKYILKRLIEISEKVVARSPKSKDPPSSTPYFMAQVKDLYNRYIDEIAQQTLRKCHEEFYCTRLVYWDLNSSQVELLEKFKAGSATADEAVRSLAENLFESIKKRVVSNILLKTYEGLLVPVLDGVAIDLQGKIAVLTDSELEEIFEITITKASLEKQLENWSQITAQHQQQEAAFYAASVDFTHPSSS
jgi:hypothetical protein